MKKESPKSILIVDDDEEIAILIEDFVSTIGNYNTVKVFSGTEALEAVGKSLPDLVLLDIMMDDIPGTEICRAIKVNKKTSHIPVIAVTAVQRVDEVLYREIMDSGVDDYVGKPFSFDKLKETVEKHLKK